MKNYLVKIRGGVEVDSAGKKAGKGPLIAEEISHTLGTSQDQYLFQAVGVDMYNQSTTGKVSRTLKCPKGGDDIPCVVAFEPGIASRDGGHVYEGVSGTLRATPGDNQMAIALENHPNDSRVKIDDSGTVQTLTSRCGTGGGNVPMVLEPVCFQQNQREEVRIMDVLGALMAESGMHNTNYVVFSKIRRAKSKDDFETWKQSVCTNTLNTFDQGDVRATDIVVCLPVEHHPQDSRAKISFDGINQPLTSNMEHDPGNGGLVICLQGNGIDRADTAGCNGKGWTEDVSYTLNTIDRPAVAYCMETFHCTTEENMTQPLKARDWKDPLVIAIDRPAFNQGKNALYDFSIESGGGGTDNNCKRSRRSLLQETIGSLCARDKRCD